MTLNEWAKEIHENACAHGWWDEERPLPEVLMLIVSELAEALEEARAGRGMEWTGCTLDDGGCYSVGAVEPCDKCAYGKPEGIAVEVADALIRILDWCGHEGIDIERIVREKHEYNRTRPYKHGKKF